MKPALAIGLFLAASVAGPASGALPVRCDAARDHLDRALVWKDVANGISYARVDTGKPDLGIISLVRFSTRIYRTRPFEMKQLDDLHATKQIFSPPSYSLFELRRFVPGAVLVSSAGSTRSYSDPIPVGWLKISGRIRSPLAAKDKILNGAVCMRSGTAAILQAAGNPRDFERCESGFQAGPLLLFGGQPTGTEFEGSLSRVFMAVADGSVLIGHASKAETGVLGCALSAPKIGAEAAINLQGYTLGGISLSPGIAQAVRVDRLGNIDALLATALVVENRR